MHKLTPKSIDALPPADGKRYDVRDAHTRGLVLRVSSAGSKVWNLTTRIKGRPRRIKIGTYPILSLADARRKAHELMRDIQLGQYVDPIEEAKAPKVLTFREIVPVFIEIYAKPRNRSWMATERVLTKFAALDDMPITDIKRSDVVRVLDDMMLRGMGTGANRALSAVKKLFAWSLDRGTIDINPVAGLRAPVKEEPRDRVLTDAELIACWHAAEVDGFPFLPFVHMLILTGQRRGEVAGMRWSEIDLAKGIWTIPAKRTKNATQHAVPLAPLALEILKSVPRFLNSDFVFTTTGTTPISGFGRLKDRLDEAVGAADWCLHDIRRTVATNMAILGVQPHIIEAVLNHKSGIVSGVAAVYNRHAYLDEKREALRAWAHHLPILKKLKQLQPPQKPLPKLMERNSVNSRRPVEHRLNNRC